MVTELEIGDVSVEVVFKDIKNLHLSVYPPTGRVRISAPARMTLENIRLFAISKLGWIRKHQTKLISQEREPPREYLERESHYLWGQRYLLRLSTKSGPNGVATQHRHIVLNVEEGTSSEKRQVILDDWYRRELRSGAEPLVAKWERQLGLRIDRVFIQRMKTKWGSSNPTNRTIRLNLELVKKPVECLDYVILHELLHFLVPNHGTQFIQMLDANMSNWRIVRNSLNETVLTQDEWVH